MRLVNGGGADTGHLLSRVAATLDSAVSAVDGFWGAQWPRQITVIASGSDEQFRTVAGGGSAQQWSDIAAVTVADSVDPVNRTMTGARILFAPGAATMDDSSLRIVLTHELFHYAARVDTALDAPRWLTEGTADFVARPRDAPSMAARSYAYTLPSDSELDAAGAQRSRAYDRAWWFARFVADSYGPARLRELYVAACGRGHRELPGAVEAVLGVDTAVLRDGWERWMKRAAW